MGRDGKINYKQWKKPEGQDIKLVAKFIESGNQKEACEAVGINYQTGKLHLRHLREYINEVMEGSGVTAEYVIDRLHQIVLNSKNHMAVIASLKLMGEHIGMWEKKMRVEVDDLKAKDIKDIVSDFKKVITDLEEVDGSYQDPSMGTGSGPDRKEEMGGTSTPKV